MDKIRINNLKFFTKNGVLAEEKRLGQQLDDISADYQEQLNKIIIKIRKYSVPMPGLFDNIEIEMEREV